MSFLQSLSNAFRSAPEISIHFNKADAKPITNNYILHNEEDLITLSGPIFSIGDDIDGRIVFNLKNANQDNPYKYESIRALCVGEVRAHNSGDNYIVSSQSTVVSHNGSFTESQTTFPFTFSNVDLTCESFTGEIFDIRWFVKVLVSRRGMSSTLTKQKMFVTQNITPEPQARPIVLQVGVDDCLHLDINLLNSRLRLNDIISGTIVFKINQLKLKSMQIQLERREALVPNEFNHENVIHTTKLGAIELMDGCPIKDISIPVRIHLSRFDDLTPSIIARYFTVRYHLNVTVIDEESRKYFKHTEIKLYRNEINYEH